MKKYFIRIFVKDNYLVKLFARMKLIQIHHSNLESVIIIQANKVSS